PAVAAALPPPPADAAAPDAGLVLPPEDAGVSSCRLAYGPAEQPFRGPAALVVSGSELRLVANDGGKPRLYPVPLAAPPPASAPPVVPPAPSSFAAMRWPACEVAGRWAYCQAPGGTVYRTTLGAHDTKAIAKSLPSTRIAAAPLGHDHAVLATLDTRHTTEGERLEAFATLDEGDAVLLSDEGAGATALRLAARGDEVVALYIDARTSMVPVHARTMTLKGAELALADDAVVYVAGSPERAVDIAVAGSPRALFTLLPIAKDSLDFGMAVIPVAPRPKDEVQAVWSMYPNGLDPAPVGATVSERLVDGGTAEAFVARVRPAERQAGSDKVLELGRLDEAGVFRSLGVLATNRPVTDITMARDGFGSLWILYGDTKSTWLERRVCP
ncbi:MAG: hypothetical protein JWP97_594, partial [Labilithrix sp.]|nr:hypothetical protein [Labilithrix sp.]